MSLPWAHLLTAIVPTYGGEPEQVIYLGLPLALLALVGSVLRRDRIGWFLAVTAAGAALFSGSRIILHCTASSGYDLANVDLSLIPALQNSVLIIFLYAMVTKTL